MSDSHVFFDPSGKRHSLIKRIGLALATLVSIAATLFFLSLLAIPFLAKSGAFSFVHNGHLLPTLPRRISTAERIAMNHARNVAWQDAQSSHQTVHSLANNRDLQIVAAFYAPWQNTGLSSLRKGAQSLTHLLPDWLLLNERGDGLDFSQYESVHNPANLKVISIAHQNGIALCPVLSNARDTDFDPVPVKRLLNSPASQQKLISSVCDWLVTNKYQGLNLDFENLPDGEYERLSQFVRNLSAKLHAAHLSLSIDLEASLTATQMQELAKPCDFVVLMAYDQHSGTDAPGPIANFDWVSQILNRTKQLIPADKIVMGIGNYAYDWTLDSKQPADSLTYQEAVLLAEQAAGKVKAQQAVNFDPDSLNATYDYQDEAGKNHQVWMLDAISAYNQWLLSKRAGLRGSALWVLGAEDPSLWNFFQRDKSTFSRNSLKSVVFPYEVSFNGQGEILTIGANAKTGERALEFDPDTGLCTDEQYTRFPSPLVLQRSGFSKNKLALTFDDGPDPEWTPQILDILKQYGVKASFFMIGENVDKYPAMVRRVYDEGHDIGNHTFTHPNLGLVSARRVRLELNATQRSIEAITGHSTRLFRPPYNADAEPQTVEEVKPMQQAAALGYLTIGEYVDPQDWNPINTAPDGTTMPRTAQEMIRDVLNGVKLGHGNIILLHDAGGDRSRTVVTLKAILPALLKRGYQFVPVSRLIGTRGREAMMPPISEHERLVIAFDSAMFSTIFGLQWLLAVGFILAIILGLARLLLTVPLAWIGRRRERSQHFDPAFKPLVSVLIAAYNEEKTIEKTVRSVLESDYPHLEVIVVDDGSKDNTSKVLSDAFDDDARVVLRKQENGGKASALNHALSLATSEYYVGFDADTQVAPDAIALLIRHFSDPQIVAVAGNVKVGNRFNILTRWQAIEYITSQNLDRCAYGLLNAITVVPGAIGAWRSQAVRDVGGYLTDTLAEDMDLTWRLRRAGGNIVNETAAIAYTEAPDTMRGLFNQRFRWAFGTLQCLTKHRHALGRNGVFGRVMLPLVWIFQFLLQWIAPLVDLQLFVAMVSTVYTWYWNGSAHGQWMPDPATVHFLQKVGYFYAIFFAAELAASFDAIREDKEDNSLLWWLFWQRVVYRQMLYCVIWKATWMALGGLRQGWNKLARKGNVTISPNVTD